MRLQLSLWAQDLPSGLVSKPDPFAVATLLQPTGKPLLLGQTEVLANTTDPDWTKLFSVDDFELGEPTTLVVSLYSNQKNSIGSVVFELGHVLGTNGSTQAKQLKTGGVIVAHVEPATEAGTLQFQLRGIDLSNTEGAGLMNKSDPFFELQRLRKTQGNKRVWDTVFRSQHLDNNLNPKWVAGCLEVDALCGGDKNQKLRLVVLDYNKSGSHYEMGKTFFTLQELLNAVTDSALADNAQDVNTDKAFVLTKEGNDVGKIVVASAEITGVVSKEQEEEPVVAEKAQPAIQEEEIIVAATDQDIVVEEERPRPTFAAYISGGCELRVIVAIDATASNGNPREESSLHHFKEGRNSYEICLLSLCSILSKYDSDHKYPVWGFGAKQDGKLSQCFTIAPSSQVEGVDGVLKAYRDAFRGGLVMSSPRDFSKVIRRAGKDVREQLHEGQAYSTLLIFTNGKPFDKELTERALAEVDDAPLSIVIVGVGDGDFSGMSELQGGTRDKLRFVHFNALEPAELAALALDPIPEQLVSYFTSQNIQPQPEVVVDEIAVEPYNEAADIVVPLEINESGEATVTGDVQVDKKEQWKQWLKDGTKVVRKEGRKFLKKNKRLVGRVRRKYENKIMKKMF